MEQRKMANAVADKKKIEEDEFGIHGDLPSGTARVTMILSFYTIHRKTVKPPSRQPPASTT